jgi:hypothetical protein
VFYETNVIGQLGIRILFCSNILDKYIHFRSDMNFPIGTLIPKISLQDPSPSITLGSSDSAYPNVESRKMNCVCKATCQFQLKNMGPVEEHLKTKSTFGYVPLAQLKCYVNHAFAMSPQESLLHWAKCQLLHYCVGNIQLGNSMRYLGESHHAHTNSMRYLGVLQNNIVGSHPRITAMYRL